MSTAQERVIHLRGAADWLEGHEWIQGIMFKYDDSGYGFESVKGACAFGALMMAVGDSEDRSTPTNLASVTFYRNFRIPLFEYNDHRFRTKEQVVAALRFVADRVEQDPSRA